MNLPALLFSLSVSIIPPTINCSANYYPPAAIRANEEGATRVRVQIAADGSITSAEVIKSSGYADLDDASIQCMVHGWHFRPAFLDGKPVESMKQFELRWSLHPSPPTK